MARSLCLAVALDLLDLSVMAWVLCVFSHQFGLLSLVYLAMSS